MIKTWIAALALIIGVVFAGGLVSAGDEVPTKVTDAVKKLAGDAKFEVDKKSAKKQTVYVAEWKSGESEHEVLMDADGKVLREEQGVTAEAVPAKVREAADKLLGTEATIKWDKITIHSESGNKILYDADSGKKEITLSDAGTLVEDDEDDDDDEQEDDDDDEEDDD